MPTRCKQISGRAVPVLLILATFLCGCNSAGEQCRKNPWEIQTPSATGHLEIELAEQKFEAAQLQVEACRKNIFAFLQDHPVHDFGDKPTEDRLRLRQLIVETERLNEALAALQASREPLSDRLTNGEALNEVELAKLEQAKQGESLLQEELDKTNARLNEIVKRRQRYIKLIREYESLAQALKTAEQERDTVIAEIKILREEENRARNTP